MLGRFAFKDDLVSIYPVEAFADDSSDLIIEGERTQSFLIIPKKRLPKFLPQKASELGIHRKDFRKSQDSSNS